MVTRELTEHSLKWRRGDMGAMGTSMFKGSLRQLDMYLLRYGPEVDITPRPFDEFTLVHTSLRVAAEITSDGQKIQVPEGRSAVIAPKQAIHLNWLSGSEALILKIPNNLIRDVQGLAPDDEPPGIPCFLVPSQLQPHWDSLVHCMLNVVASQQVSDLNPEWVDHLERGVVDFLLKHQPAEASHAKRSEVVFDIEGASALTPREGAQRIEKVYAYMQSRLSAPISLFDLARAGGVGVRTLSVLCRKHFGLSPMEVLRNLRLDSIRSRLLLQPDANISHVALDFGFGNPGRFAAYYRERFNELPHETQRRVSGAPAIANRQAGQSGRSPRTEG